jgi:hypothetical protein
MAHGPGDQSAAEENSEIWIHNIAQTGINKSVTFTTVYTSTSSYPGNSSEGGGAYQGDTNAITAIRILYSSSNISAGQCSLYGLNH